MKTTVEIDDDLIREAMKALKVRTKREAIETGLREVLRHKNLAALRKELGTFDLDLDLDELERLRGDG